MRTKKGEEVQLQELQSLGNRPLGTGWCQVCSPSTSFLGLGRSRLSRAGSLFSLTARACCEEPPVWSTQFSGTVKRCIISPHPSVPFSAVWIFPFLPSCSCRLAISAQKKPREALIYFKSKEHYNSLARSPTMYYPSIVLVLFVSFTLPRFRPVYSLLDVHASPFLCLHWWSNFC